MYGRTSGTVPAIPSLAEQHSSLTVLVFITLLSLNQTLILQKRKTMFMFYAFINSTLQMLTIFVIAGD